MKRGLWHCSRCKRIWIYNVEDHIMKLDKICHGCGKRNRATIYRKPGKRGRGRKTIVEPRPSYMPLHALEKERQNKMAYKGKPTKSFRRASEIPKPKPKAWGIAALPFTGDQE